MGDCDSLTCAEGGKLLNSESRPCVGESCLEEECCFNETIPAFWPDSSNSFTVDLSNLSNQGIETTYNSINDKCTGKWEPVNAAQEEVRDPICYDNNYIKFKEPGVISTAAPLRKAMFEDSEISPCWKMFKYIPEENDYRGTNNDNKCPLSETDPIINYKNCDDEPGEYSGCGICKDYCFQHHVAGGAVGETREERIENSCMEFNTDVEYGRAGAGGCIYNEDGLSVESETDGCVPKSLIGDSQGYVRKRLPYCRIKSLTGEVEGSCIEGKCMLNNTDEVCEQKNANYSEWMWPERNFVLPNFLYLQWYDGVFLFFWITIFVVANIWFINNVGKGRESKWYVKLVEFIIILAFGSWVWWSWFHYPITPCTTDSCGEDCISGVWAIFTSAIVLYVVWKIFGSTDGGKKK